MYQVSAHPPYFREEENETINLNSRPVETESCDYDFQW